MSERHLHWATAVPFIVCYTTALILVLIYNPDPNRPYRAVFSWIHRLSGVCLFVAPLWTFLRHRRDFSLHFRNVLTAWRWRIDDLKWLLLIGPATINKRIELPDQEKFNAGEKINFVFLTATYPIYLITGLLIWLPGVAYLSWLIHLSMAATATPLILGHVFMATVNPDTRVGLRGMISGYVNRHWAQHHYRCWYDEHFAHLHRKASPAVKPAVEPAVKAVVAPAAQATVTLRGSGSQSVPAAVQEKAVPASAWPPLLRPAPGSRAARETT